MQRREERIQILDAAATHQRERAAEPVGEPPEQRLECRIGARIQGRVGELDQGAVDVQEQAPGLGG
jgi:hypothetical protein